MNSVSMPSRPVSRARPASSSTTPMPPGTLLAGPATVTVEVLAGAILLVALAVAAGADAKQHVDQPYGQARPDDPQSALPAVVLGPKRDRRDASGDDDGRKPDAYERHHGTSVHGSVGSVAGSNRATSSAGPGRSPGAARPRLVASIPRTAPVSSPSAARSA